MSAQATGAHSGGVAELLAYAARLISRAGLVQAFGHISARLPDGGFMLTPTTPLLQARAQEMLKIDGAGTVLAGGEGRCPKEAPLHGEIYAARSDVGAICRTHSPAAVIWGSRGQVPPVVHGLGGLSGEVALHRSPQLVTSEQAGSAAAVALGSADCMLLYANGAVCTAPRLEAAVVRAWFLEERSQIAERGAGAGALDPDQMAERSGHYEAEQERAWEWLRARFGTEESQSITEAPVEAT